MLLTVYEICQIILLFGLGAALTSFFNAQIYRIENQMKLKDLILTPSQCENCKKDLSWYELIPVFSFVFQKGRCAKCGMKIPILYPITEALFGFSLVLLWYYQVKPEIYLLASLLYFLALYDLFYKGFPKNIMHAFLIVGITVFVYRYFTSIEWSFVPIYLSIAVGLIVLFFNRIRMSFGEGDLLVVILLSFFFPLKQLLSVIIIGLMISGFSMIGLMLIKKVTRKDMVPFVPFLYLGLLAYFPLQIYIDKYFAYILYLW
ncbi:prepilin peptidase [Candidatus Nomurabacteria bacterium]|uniref:Prepilin peptidase n=1 Tax=Candidatus Dojkabacteria bacterium TaxID=2099670 RepID=A0A955KY88_9BACT|nr:prepilin peptidase [Candidatus Dojkabacteria bacterium]MCB9789861.1 prepilin peptidase [Candidatus Nomurabacteria bacterium]MCB9803515.1 prepilin peptidase [Candidatus Nomurabacteria bacterium]